MPKNRECNLTSDQNDPKLQTADRLARLEHEVRSLAQRADESVSVTNEEAAYAFVAGAAVHEALITVRRIGNCERILESAAVLRVGSGPRAARPFAWCLQVKDRAVGRFP